jgi:hypothetical protein
MRELCRFLLYVEEIVTFLCPSMETAITTLLCTREGRAARGAGRRLDFVAGPGRRRHFRGTGIFLPPALRRATGAWRPSRLERRLREIPAGGNAVSRDSQTKCLKDSTRRIVTVAPRLKISATRRWGHSRRLRERSPPSNRTGGVRRTGQPGIGGEAPFYLNGSALGLTRGKLLPRSVSEVRVDEGEFGRDRLIDRRLIASRAKIRCGAAAFHRGSLGNDPLAVETDEQATVCRVGAYVLAIAFFADLSVRANIARQRPSLCSAPHLERNEAAEVQYTMAWTTLHVLGLDATLIEGSPAHCELVLRRNG